MSSVVRRPRSTVPSPAADANTTSPVFIGASIRRFLVGAAWRLAASVPIMRILIRNMSRETTEKDVRDLFEPFGPVQSCVIVDDAETGRSKGFGFVEMPKAGDAKAAIQHLNGQVLAGATLRVKRAS